MAFRSIHITNVPSGPTYATWDPAHQGVAGQLSNGNLTVTDNTTSTGKGGFATVGKSTGKWYWELTWTKNTSLLVGICTSAGAVGGFMGGDSATRGYYNFGYKTNGSLTFMGAWSVFNTGVTLGVAWDADNGNLYFRNGASGWLNTSTNGYDSTPTVAVWTGISGTQYPCWSTGNLMGTLVANFGASAFTYTVPTGFTAGIY